ncbi:Transcription initiation factor TFIID subunit 12 [Hypoxylon texense]
MGTWGRYSTGRSWLRSALAATPVVLAPMALLILFITLYQFDGSLPVLYLALKHQGLWSVIDAYRPRFDLHTTLAYSCWIVFQAVLFQWLPGPRSIGQRTPAGHVLDYRTNGLSAWVITHLALAALCWKGGLDPAFVPRNWSGLVFAMNMYGFLASAVAFIKGHLMPTHSEDTKFSELNPRVGNFDLKLFTNGRIGMMAWTVIDLSNVAYQYQEFGRASPSILLVTILHTIYVLDFFNNEEWYLRTIDIAHEHYGFYLAWGCFAFLPVMYTLQTQYLGRHPTSPSGAYLLVAFTTGLVGYALFRSVNDQKARVRRLNGDCLVWGRPARYIRTTYMTSDGWQHESLLLASGWWGWSRHANYLGDLLLSFSMCALVGTTNVVMWAYALFMTILLMHRCIRDEVRGRSKYGTAWDDYCRRVPWRLVPGLW